MNEELTIENIEQWNEEHPEDCHSPWMGGLDGECETIASEKNNNPIQEVETNEAVAPTEDVQQESYTVSEDVSTECVTISVEEHNQEPAESQAITVVESDIEPIAKSPCTGESNLIILIFQGIIGFEILIIIGYIFLDKLKWW